MTALLLALVLLQGNPAPTGIATGVVRSLNGSPAAGVRVFAIPAGDPNKASNGPTVFESLAQTDASGRYKLELPAGRYYIGAGSVNSPTYYPDTSSIISAKVIAIAAGTAVENVDFSRYTAASQQQAFGPTISMPPPLPPGSTGVLSGVVRNFDGSVASGITVVAVPVSAVSSSMSGTNISYSAFYFSTIGTQIGAFQALNSLAIASARLSNGGRLVTTDVTGTYRMDMVSPDTYKLFAGYSDLPVFYPGESDIQKAMPLTTSPTTALTNLDFTLPRPAAMYSITGKVSADQGKPAGGATLTLQSVNRSATIGISSLLPNRTYPKIATSAEGMYEFVNVVPGQYSLQASLSGATAKTATVNVMDRSVMTDFEFPMKVLTGHIVWEDGTAFVDSSVGDVTISTTSNPNVVLSSILTVSKDGAFSGVIEPEEYRFYIRSLPDQYDVRSITSGGLDLTKEHLVFDREGPKEIVIRVAKRVGNGARVQGKVLNAVPRTATSAERVELCCFSNGPFERLSAALQADGSFDFPGVPSGRYSAELRGKTGPSTPSIVNSAVVVEDRDISGLVLLNSNQTSWLVASVLIDGSGVVRSAMKGLEVSVTIPAGPGKEGGDVVIPLTSLPDGSFQGPIPTGALYTLSPSSLPEGYRVKLPTSISGAPSIPMTQLVIEKIPGK